MHSKPFFRSWYVQVSQVNLSCSGMIHGMPSTLSRKNKAMIDNAKQKFSIIKFSSREHSDFRGKGSQTGTNERINRSFTHKATAK
jgi:hypothetical protein